MRVVVLGRFIVRVELRGERRARLGGVLGPHLCHATKKKKQSSSHPNCHETDVGVFGALHEYERRISGVLDDHFFCHFSRSYEIIRKSQSERGAD